MKKVHDNDKKFVEAMGENIKMYTVNELVDNDSSVEEWKLFCEKIRDLCPYAVVTDGDYHSKDEMLEFALLCEKYLENRYRVYNGTIATETQKDAFTVWMFVYKANPKIKIISNSPDPDD